MIPPILCKRAAVVLGELETGQLAVTADEIEQLLKLGLAVETNPTHLAAAMKLAHVREEFAEHFEDPLDPAGYTSALADIEGKLKNEWYRLRTSKARIREHEASRVELRGALGILNDPVEMASMRSLIEQSQLVESSAKYYACPALGIEVYAITLLGKRVLHDLRPRLNRVGDAPLSAFMKSFNKANAKMAAFSQEIAVLSKGVGFVKKHPEQVVIGLAKSGLPPQHALGSYHDALAHTRAADIAVTCARNAAQSGGAINASQRLQMAIAALAHAGFPRTPVMMGAAKSLLSFDPPSAGAPRFAELHQRLAATYGNSDVVFKYIVRLMPATGTPHEVVHRSVLAGHAIADAAKRHGSPRSDSAALGVAIAAMVKTEEALPPAIERFFAIEHELTRQHISVGPPAAQHALECLSCPGTPPEVAITVRSLCEQIAPGWPPLPATASIATSFAKRFAY